MGEAHRALGDVHESIAELRSYRETILGPTSGADPVS
jgi:oligoribonuclease (3'-5' exoribonuclease)